MIAKLGIKLSNQPDIKIKNYHYFSIVQHIKRLYGFAGKVFFASYLSEDLKNQIIKEALGEDILLSTISGASTRSRILG